jgi:hypothetical protein
MYSVASSIYKATVVSTPVPNIAGKLAERLRCYEVPVTNFDAETSYTVRGFREFSQSPEANICLTHYFELIINHFVIRLGI